MKIEKILAFKEEITSSPLFESNSKRKNFFLATCLSINPHIDLKGINAKTPFGGLIGVDDSRLDRVFCFSKILRMHAVFHDASGFMKSYNNEGPGYCYVIGDFLPEYSNNCYLGHITGIAYCSFLKIFFKDIFDSFDL